MKAVNLGSKHVEEFITELKSQGKANGTVNRSLQLLSQAYRYAASANPPKLTRALTVPKLDESDCVRQGKFTPEEAEMLFRSLPAYMVDVARFAYEVGARSGEIRQLRWQDLNYDSIHVPAHITKTKKARIISLTPELEEIIERRKKARITDCHLIFHHDGHAIVDYRKAWHTACVINGLGAFYCRDCRDGQGHYDSALDAKKTCPRCGQHWVEPRYIGRLFHDFRRSAAHELWKSGNSTEECMAITGHVTSTMFKRYADLFSDDEKKARQQATQQRRREWKAAQSANVIAMPKPEFNRTRTKHAHNEREADDWLL
jgi:integrase